MSMGGESVFGHEEWPVQLVEMLVHSRDRVTQFIGIGEEAAHAASDCHHFV